MRRQNRIECDNAIHQKSINLMYENEISYRYKYIILYKPQCDSFKVYSFNFFEIIIFN